MAEGVGPDAFVTVAVTTELVKRLSVWSEPVQVMVIETPGIGTGYEMIARPPAPHVHDVNGCIGGCTFEPKSSATPAG